MACLQPQSLQAQLPILGCSVNLLPVRNKTIKASFRGMRVAPDLVIALEQKHYSSRISAEMLKVSSRHQLLERRSVFRVFIADLGDI